MPVSARDAAEMSWQRLSMTGMLPMLARRLESWKSGIASSSAVSCRRVPQIGSGQGNCCSVRKLSNRRMAAWRVSATLAPRAAVLKMAL